MRVSVCQRMYVQNLDQTKNDRNLKYGIKKISYNISKNDFLSQPGGCKRRKTAVTSIFGIPSLAIFRLTREKKYASQFHMEIAIRHVVDKLRSYMRYIFKMDFSEQNSYC